MPFFAANTAKKRTASAPSISAPIDKIRNWHRGHEPTAQATAQTKSRATAQTKSQATVQTVGLLVASNPTCKAGNRCASLHAFAHKRRRLQHAKEVGCVVHCTPPASSNTGSRENLGQTAHTSGARKKDQLSDFG
jgi:hypothetical protein